MNPANRGCGGGDGEDPSSKSSSASVKPLTIKPSTHQDQSLSPESESMKRAAAKKLIERYFYQVTDGCGDPECDNSNCVSSGKMKNMKPNEAAAMAIQLFSQEARLCEPQRKIARTQDISAKTPTTPEEKSVPYLNEEKLLEILESCKREDSYSKLIRTIGAVFSNMESLLISFVKKPNSPLEAMLSKAPSNLRNLKKEDIRTLQGDLDKDEDSQEEAEKEGECSSQCQTSGPDEITLDLESLRRAYSALFSVDSKVFESALINALITLTGMVELDLKMFHNFKDEPNVVNIFLIMLELPCLSSYEYMERTLPGICRAASHLPLAMQAKLVRVLAKHCSQKLKGLLDSLQQIITLKVITSQFSLEYTVYDEETVTSATRLIKIIYYASILAGEMDSPELRIEDEKTPEEVEDDHFGEPVSGLDSREPDVTPPDPFAEELQINFLDSRKPLISFSEFYNEPLSDVIEMDKDYTHFKNRDSSNRFSFLNHPFILTPFTRSLGLYYDNRVRMFSERRVSLLQSVVGNPTSPYLRLRVKRDRIIEDALVELEVVAMANPTYLKKQLVVEFEGEQGIDEGGVSKEFFQLVVEEIFNPDYGMFTHQKETETVWFNPTSFESDAQFTLIGIVLGLAIYNNVILDVHFPMVVYCKLMGKKGCFHDLKDWNPTLYAGLKELLEYEGDDMEDTFMQTFRICYQDIFGNTFNQDLKENGDQIFVNKNNRQEFIDLYADFLLNKSIAKQFRAFRKGFRMVTDESPLHILFRPEEVEQLVCGSRNFDFNALEAATEYDGYAADSPIIRHFWGVVHELPIESKRRLLQFATGSDRVPVGGMSKLKLIIARQGPDSDRLPTAHTCFNVLLLPEYDSREKLHDRLLKAINYSKGFGML
ncbi:ubiquitin-protein ligase E3A [Neocloeon triangulifer]|uniref:ubiquitin-protein ligase E3A n=1 Tax=Neocloeon triangulifer TaxID=2078957 RepID=UPI00286ED6BD|nr:ubiquitin-protein ligase E3A [Neocloeon triangulifer]